MCCNISFQIKIRFVFKTLSTSQWRVSWKRFSSSLSCKSLFIQYFSISTLSFVLWATFIVSGAKIFCGFASVAIWWLRPWILQIARLLCYPIGGTLPIRCDMKFGFPTSWHHHPPMINWRVFLATRRNCWSRWPLPCGPALLCPEQHEKQNEQGSSKFLQRQTSTTIASQIIHFEAYFGLSKLLAHWWLGRGMVPSLVVSERLVGDPRYHLVNCSTMIWLWKITCLSRTRSPPEFMFD